MKSQDDSWSDLPGDDERSGFDPKLVLLYGAARMRGWLCLATLVGIAAGLLYAASLPNTYTSSASLTLYSGLRERQNVEAGVGIESDPRYGPGIADEIELLSDPAIYERVAAELGPAWVLALPDPTADDGPHSSGPVRALHRLQGFLFQMRAEDAVPLAPDNRLAVRKAGRHLLAHTRLEAVRNSAVIKVHHTAYTPERARRAATALAAAFADRHREQYQASRNYKRQLAQKEQTFAAFQDAQARYDAHRAECGFLDLAREKEALLGTLNRLEVDRAAARARQVEVDAELAVLRGNLSRMESFLEDTTPERTAPNPEHEEWTRRSWELRSQFGLVADKSGPRVALERERSALRRQITAVEKRLEGLEPVLTVVPETTRRVPNEEYFRLEGRVAELEAELAGLNRRLEGDDGLARTRGRLQTALACESIHGLFELEVATERDVYTRLAQRTRELEALAGLDAEGVANLAVTIPPSLPTGKDGPQRLKPLAAGTAAGFALGLLLAVLVQLLDRRVRYPETVERDMGLTLLTVVPEVPALETGRQRAAA